MKKKMSVLTTLIVLATMILSACAPAATPAAPAATNPPAPAEPTATTAAPAPAEPTATTAAAAPAEPTATTAAGGEPTAVPTATFPPPVNTGGENCDPAATRVTWFVGLGAGSNPPEVQQEKAWVEKFNGSQKEACVILNVVYNSGQNSYDALRAMIAGGNAPEIVGPVGKAGRASFQGAWADLTPLAETAGFDLAQYDPKLLEFTKDEGVLVGLPFALFPSFIFYNKKAFDEAQLPYPPHKVGEKYDGKDWNLETFQELAQKLTVDQAGNDATNEAFDPKSVTQFGFFEQYTDARGIGALWGGAIPYDEATKKAVIPESYVKAWTWYYDGIWKNNFMPNADYQNSDQFNKGNCFASGNIAMAHVHTWYLCCFDPKAMDWDIAVMPTIDGKITAKLHGDTFAILKDSKEQVAAFKVLSQMVKDPELNVLYGGMPAVESERPAFFTALDQRVAPNKIDWSVAEEMLNYPDLPNHESWLPNLAKANTLLGTFRTTMDQTPDLNLTEAIEKLKADLDEAYSSAP